MLSNITEYRQRVEAFARESWKIRSWLWRYSHRKSVLDDLAQDACEQLLKVDPEKVSNIRDFEPYAYGICQHVGVNWFRRLQQYAQLERKVKLQPKGAASTPEKSALITERLARMHTIVVNLPRVQRKTYLMRYVYGYSTKEIAARRGRTQATVRKTLSEALSTIREKMSEEASVNRKQSISGLLGLEE